MSITTTYYSWVGSGLGTAHDQRAGDDGWPLTAERHVTAGVAIGALGAEITHEAALRGPADVLRLDPSAIRRSTPEPGTQDCAPNFFASVEFHRPELPWLYTPARPGDAGRLAPWLVLVVVPLSESVRLRQQVDPPITRLEIDSGAGALLPPLTESYAWAHAQDDPGAAPFSRLLCPTRLAPASAYAACLVPSFDGGRLAGLGREPGPDSITPAWTAEAEALELPVYHHWHFATGTADFETVVRRLRPHPADKTVGLHDMDLSAPGGGLDLADLGHAELAPRAATVSFEGALVSPVAAPKPWPKAHAEPFREALQEHLKDGATLPRAGRGYHALRDDPVVSAPTYGRWQTESVLNDPKAPRWMAALNLSPKQRAAAGLGALAVRRNQEPLMAEAWAQAAEMREVQEVLRATRLALPAARAIHKRLASMAPEKILGVTSAAHADLTVDGRSNLRAAMQRTPSTEDLGASPAFRRAGVRASAALKVKTEAVLQATAQISLDGTASRLGKGLVPRNFGVTLREDKDSKRRTTSATARVKRSMTVETPGPARVTGARPATLSAGVLTQADPLKTLPAVINQRVANLTPLTAPKGRVPIPRRAVLAPRFRLATSRLLQAIDPEVFLPGFSALPDDSVSILTINARFVESYMVGLNHEMAREFAFRRFPTALSGTWFHRFWNHEAAPEAEDIPDIARWHRTRALGQHTLVDAENSTVVLIKGDLFRRFPQTRVYAAQAYWDKATAAPQSQRSRTDKFIANQPGRVRFAKLDDPGALILPGFTGSIGREAAYFSFPLSAAEMNGTIEDERAPGWFIVFEQPQSAPTFGLDSPEGVTTGATPPALADRLHWGHFGAPLHAPAQPDWWETPIQGARWGGTSAETARLAFQSPVRILFHASGLIAGASL